jgi:hypothetical protein
MSGSNLVIQKTLLPELQNFESSRMTTFRHANEELSLDYYGQPHAMGVRSCTRSITRRIFRRISRKWDRSPYM